VERYVAADLAHLDAGLAATASIHDPVQRVVAFLRFYEDGADQLMDEQTGCLYATVLAERQFTGTEINHRVADAERSWRQAFGDLLRAALADRPTDIDIDALADHLFTTFEGGFILCRTLEDPGAMRRQLGTFRRLVEALLVAANRPTGVESGTDWARAPSITVELAAGLQGRSSSSPSP
jgi:TetR/AcrR family transcriptional repressor of nem operon